MEREPAMPPTRTRPTLASKSPSTEFLHSGAQSYRWAHPPGGGSDP